MINHWISGILGLIVALVPFLVLSETTLSLTLVLAGLAIAASSFWGMFVDSKEDQTHRLRGQV